MSFAKIRPRRGTAKQWNNANPILAEGEIGIEVPSEGVGSGLIKMKFGDGSTAWNDLPYGVDIPKDVSTLLANPYIKGTPCTVGNYYILGDKLYWCKQTTDGTIPVTNLNYFSETTVGEKLKDLNDAISGKEENLWSISISGNTGNNGYLATGLSATIGDAVSVIVRSPVNIVGFPFVGIDNKWYIIFYGFMSFSDINSGKNLDISGTFYYKIRH